MSDLIGTLRARGREFNFFRALQLLEERFGDVDPLQAGHHAPRRVSFTADPSLGFPAAAISCVEGDEQSLRFTLNFMGLCGAASPLPSYFPATLQYVDGQEKALYDFLAIFQHRLYTLFYRAWKQYAGAQAGTHPSSSTRCLAILFGTAPGSPGGPSRLPGYAGLLAGRSRSAAGLETLLRYHLGAPVRVRQWYPRWVRMPSPRGLGHGLQLGAQAFIGTHTYGCTHSFRIILGPLPRELFLELLENGTLRRELVMLVTTYMVDPLVYDVELLLARRDLAPAILGGTNAALGRTASLGQSAPCGDPIAVRLTPSEVQLL